MLILNRRNLSFLDGWKENEIVLSINVVEDHNYCMSPELALELAEMLEAKAREVIAQQAEKLAAFDARKAARR